MSECGGLREEKDAFEWVGVEDLPTLLEGGSNKETLGALLEEERVVSYRRHVLQGEIDLSRGERLRRGSVALSPEELTRSLMGEEGLS